MFYQKPSAIFFLKICLRRGMVDKIFSLKTNSRKMHRAEQPLYMVFVDFTKAFDIVHREMLWKILQKIVCPDLFVDLIASLQKDMKDSVILSKG